MVDRGGSCGAGWCRLEIPTENAANVEMTCHAGKLEIFISFSFWSFYVLYIFKGVETELDGIPFKNAFS